jgi:hypothetical protein
MSSEAATASKIEEDEYIIGYVYIISDTKNNQYLYIGSSHNIKNRLNKHFSDLNKNKNELYNYINILGIENINIKILDVSIYKNKYELRNKEQDYINSYTTIFNKNKAFLNISYTNKSEYNRLYNYTDKRIEYIKNFNSNKKIIKFINHFK